jgi:hypothetical protein
MNRQEAWHWRHAMPLGEFLFSLIISASRKSDTEFEEWVKMLPGTACIWFCFFF